MEAKVRVRRSAVDMTCRNEAALGASKIRGPTHVGPVEPTRSGVGCGFRANFHLKSATTAH